MKQITVKLEDKPGQIFKMCDAIGKNGVNITSLFGGQDGVFRIITEDEKTAIKALTHLGIKTELHELLIIDITDKPGELAKVTARLAHDGININSMFLITRDKDRVKIGMDVDNIEKARKSI